MGHFAQLDNVGVGKSYADLVIFQAWRNPIFGNTESIPGVSDAST
jgi:hypothetical protein